MIMESLVIEGNSTNVHEGEKVADMFLLLRLVVRFLNSINARTRKRNER